MKPIAPPYRFNRQPWLVVLLLVLTGCGTDTGDVDPPAANYAAYETQFVNLRNTWGSSGYTDPTTLPAGGSASYTGVMRLSVETSAGALKMDGAMTLTSTFSTNSLSGNVRSFADQNNVAMNGSLAITGGVLDRAANTGVEYTYSANIGGTLSGGGDSFAILGDLSGDFLGPSYLATTGVVAGTATSAFGAGYMFGEFIAAQ